MWHLVRLYLKLYWFARDHRVVLPGIGVALRLLMRPRWFSYSGLQYFFEPRVASSYFAILAGRCSEPGTRHFLSRVLTDWSSRSIFINVGANVGEFCLPLAYEHPHLSVMAFDPLPGCSQVLRQTAERNQLTNLAVAELAIGSIDGSVALRESPNSHTSYVSQDTNPQGGQSLVPIKTLDALIPQTGAKIVMLIDVEGNELEVFRGARHLLANNDVIAVFEFTPETKRVFNLNDVQQLVGSDYQVKRLTDSGDLDDDIDHSWNCVLFRTSLSNTVQGGVN